VRAERGRLTRLAQTSADAAARARYQQAVDTRDLQLADCAQLRAQAARLDAELSALHAKLDALHSQLLKLTSLRAASGLGDATDRVLDNLNTLSNELGALTEAYDSLTSTKEPS
jgi:predicted  nucleic acid-binding Zn-ribbon protein